MRAMLRRGCRVLLAAFAIGWQEELLADDSESLIGTHQVSFMPMQRAGYLVGCQLVFMAVQRDFAYMGGAHVTLNGSIFVTGSDGRIAITLKLGVAEFKEPLQFERPHFAYLQTGNGSTARSLHQTTDGDPGFRMITFPFDENGVKVMSDVVDEMSVTIGFNRNERGVDVLTPIDLSVSDTSFIPPDRFVRNHSMDAAIGYAECVQSLISGMIEAQETR